jgi:hypothetical protein
MGGWRSTVVDQLDKVASEFVRITQIGLLVRSIWEKR